jgi:uracil-DNA glycosylase family 4
MTGFFHKKETDSLLTNASGKKLSCYGCGLYKGEIQSPKMQPTGKFKKKILNIGEFTNGNDDMKGKPFQGKDRIIYKEYERLGIDIEEDCLNVNAVMCHPYDKKTNKDRVPTQYEIDCCRINIMKVIQQYKPKLIVLFGKVALVSVIGKRWKDSLDTIDKWRGFVIPDQELCCWIAPVYAASYVDHFKRPEMDKVWREDLQRALNALNKPFPTYKEPKITYIKNLSVLDDIPNYTTVSIDYETTGLKPNAKGHRIVCASVAINENEAFTFPMPKTAEERRPFINLLKNKFIFKMSHNMKFEHTWSKVILKTSVRSWKWDSMLAAHVLDNRQSVTGLKFQTYINFGVIDYSSTVSKWLQAKDDKNANSQNRLIEFFETESGQKEVLKYCALDTINQYRLAKLQEELFNNILPF